VKKLDKYYAVSWVGITIQVDRIDAGFLLKCNFSFIIEGDFINQDII